MRVGVLGCGSIGSRHARNLIAMGHVAILADNDEARVKALCDELGENAVDGCVAWCADADAVMICTPAATHSAVARDLLLQGCSGPLFCEKPLALSVEDCEVFRSWPHPTTMVGYNLRFHPFVRVFRGTLADGCYMACHCDMRSWPGTSYGMPFLEMSHEIDLAALCGAPPLRYAEVGNRYAELIFGEDHRVSLQWEQRGYFRRWSTHADDLECRVTFTRPDQLGDQMYVDELAHFLACAEKHEPTITPFADGIRVVDVCEQALKLAKVQA